MITLEQLLESRDRRYARQVEWIRRHEGTTLVCMTVILPGSVKRDERTLRIAKAGTEAVRKTLEPLSEQLYDLETGFEGYFSVDGSVLDVKRICCEIEDTHPLGRLMDLDVLEPAGEGVVPVSRSRIGFPPRRCLLCDLPARVCMRAKTHSREALLAKIDEMLDLFSNL